MEEFPEGEALQDDMPCGACLLFAISRGADHDHLTNYLIFRAIKEEIMAAV